ncbi:MAG: FAD:protein FMN transferase, partial [Gemmatimonadaceae bacterium]
MRSLRDTTFGRAISAWPRGGRAPQPQKHVFHYEHVLGTSLELHVVAADEADARRAESDALDEVDRLEPILSGWSATSELARWQATQGEDVPVSPELADVLEAAEWWRILTGGAFNPAAQQVVESLRDGSAPGNVSGPHWMVDRVHGTARRFSAHAVSLDAIAKGYIVSRAARCARASAGV